MLFTYTDPLAYDIRTDDFYADIKDIHDRFDTSEYPKDIRSFLYLRYRNGSQQKSYRPHCVAWNKYANEKIYFDSYGLHPPTEVLKYLHSSVYYNTERIQPHNEVFCGHLCLYVLKNTSGTTQLRYSFQDVINGLH